MLPSEILAESTTLFHDVRPEDVDPESHAEFVIGRVLDRGTLRSVGALLRFDGQERIRDFVRQGGAARLSPRTVPLWLAYLDVTPEPCTPRSSPPRSSPFWSA